MIRPAIRSDFSALGRLGAALMRTHYAFDRRRFLAPGDDAESGYASFLEEQLADEDAIVLVAVRDEQVVGYVYAALEPMSWKELRGPAGFIHDILVDAPAQRLGIARHLLDQAIAWLRERGAPRVMLWTAPQNHAARKLFAEVGFRETMIEMTLD